jgi:hypothetical protein
MDFVADRDTLDTWAANRGEDGIKKYWQDTNRLSLDGFDTGIVG